MNEQTIPRWKVIQLIMSMRKRLCYYEQTQDEKIPVKTRTWASNYRYNRSKILYRHGYKNKEKKKPDNNWNRAITFQKQKLCRRYDLHYSWRAKEYEMLEKMNTHAFAPYDDNGIIWKIIINNQRVKICELVSKVPQEQAQGSITWNSLIDKAQKKIWYEINKKVMNQKNHDQWILNIRANKDKLRRHHSKLSWDYSIYDNYAKLRRRFINENNMEEL